jgi:hypothetical protein
MLPPFVAVALVATHFSRAELDNLEVSPIAYALSAYVPNAADKFVVSVSHEWVYQNCWLGLAGRIWA